jgi:uncharacterized protein (TIGR02246 family)
MKMKRVALAVSFACLPLVAQAQAAKTDPAISKLTKELATAMSGKDAAKVAAFYTEDATFNPPNEPPVRGRAAIQAWMQKLYDQGSASLSLTPVESAISGNIAYSYETYTFTFTPKGAPPMVEKGKSVVVYKQVGGKWLLAHDIFNADTPPPPAPPAKAAAPAKPAPPKQ